MYLSAASAVEKSWTCQPCCLRKPMVNHLSSSLSSTIRATGVISVVIQESAVRVPTSFHRSKATALPVCAVSKRQPAPNGKFLFLRVTYALLRRFIICNHHRAAYTFANLFGFAQVGTDAGIL